jgi:arylsulfatase A-like enzyme
MMAVIFFLPIINTGNMVAPVAPSTIPTVDPPNVLMIMLDDAGAQYMDVAHTPHIDWIASQGTKYTQAVANSTGCNPSRVSFATGLMPLCVDSMSETDWRATMNACSAGLGDNVRTMYQEFAAAGYSTVAVGKIMHTAEQQSAEFQASYFMEAEDILPEVANRPLHGLTAFYASGSDFKDWGAVEDLRGPTGETFTEQDMMDWRITDKAVDEIGALQEPFFAAVGLASPHLPRYVPQRFMDKYMGVPVPDVLLNDFDDMPHEGRTKSFQRSQNRIVVDSILTHQDRWREFNAAYYASLEVADIQVGRLLAAVPEDTIIVLWSDHGYHLGQKGKIEKGTLWRESYMVPLIMAGPGIEAGAVVTQVTNSTMVYPTLMATAGITPTDGITRTAITDGLIAFEGDVAIDDGAFSLIQYNALTPLQNKQEFYDLQNDPLQWRVLTGGTEYRQRLSAYLSSN